MKLFGHAMAELESLGVRMAKVKAGVDTRPQDFIFQVPYIGKCVRSAGHTLRTAYCHSEIAILICLHPEQTIAGLNGQHLTKFSMGLARLAMVCRNVQTTRLEESVSQFNFPLSSVNLRG